MCVYLNYSLGANKMKRSTLLSLLLVLSLLLIVAPVVAQDATEEPAAEVAYDPEACFQAAPSNDSMVSYPAREPPYTIGLANSFIGNAWRTQMIQMAQAWAA